MPTDNSIQVDDRRVRILLQGIQAQAADLSPAMAHISHKLQNSVQANFTTGGRFLRAGSIMGGDNRWEKKRDRSPCHLTRSGHLKNSIMPEHTETEASASTNVEYAAIHNFGGTRYAHSELFTRNRSGRGSLKAHPNLNPFSGGTKAGHGQTYKESSVPARPYMVIQQLDIEDAKTILVHHVLGRSGNV
jgi:phage gpG-like protein